MSDVTTTPALGAHWRTDTARILAGRLSGMLGDRTAKPFAAMGIDTVGDLLRHVPRRWMAGTENSSLAELVPGEEAAVIATVHSSRITNNRLEVVITDGSAPLRLTFFGGPSRKGHSLLTYWESQLPAGARGIFAGKVGVFRDELQLTHPQFVTIDEDGHVVGGAKRNETMGRISQAGGLIGIYPQTRKLPTWTIAESVGIVLDQIELEDPWPDWVRQEAGVVDLMTALRAVHRPQTRDEIELGLERLRFDEALRTQLTMAQRRAVAAAHHAVPRVRVAGGLLDTFDTQLPFTLTNGQLRTGEQIFDDLAQDRPMQRLLQGEVGSGKTLVALRAMLGVVDSGGQTALLAPTEVLAAQHARNIERLLGDLGLGGTLAAPEQATRVVLLTGSLPAKAKREALLAIASGEAGIVVGTHALLADRVQFADLGLVVVDEQHRFGVEQRARLSDRTDGGPHVLVMTATPIPRTVAMTIFGDLVVSSLDEIPAGRSEVSTVVVDERAHPGWVARAWQRIVEEVAAGRQAFVVCPRIGDPPGSTRIGDPPGSSAPKRGRGAGADEEDPGRGVLELYEELRTGPLAALRVGVVHGQLPADEKDAAMVAFAHGELDVIVATTVIEVGVDVPNASVMVISNADRFGISQLHQLRGRIGRGAHPGVCLLLTSAEAGTPARERLDAVARTRDGFALAEVDLAQRREGDVLGAAQSGARSSLRLLRVLEHAPVIELAREVAVRAVADDPDLATPGFADAITETELAAQEEWLDRN